MTPTEIVIRALNSIKNSNLKRGNKNLVQVGNVKQLDDAIRFTISKIDESPQGNGMLDFDDTYYEIPIAAIRQTGGKTKTATAMGQFDVKWTQKG